MFDLIDGEQTDLKNATYQDFVEGKILISKGDYKKAMDIIHHVFGLMIAVDTQEIFIFDNDKGYYKEISKDQLTGLYEKLTGENMSTATSDVFKRKIFRWFGEPYCLRKHSIMARFEDSSKRFVCFKNGVFDIQSEKFFSHRKTIYFRNCIDANYTDDQDTPIFNMFMKDFTSNREDVERTLMEYMAYCFVSGYHFGHNFLVLNGSGRNGKSTLIRLISNVIGHTAVSHVPMDQLFGFELESIAGKLLNCTMEDSGKWTDGAALANLKAITGGDSISINAKYKKSYSESNLPKLIFAMNQLPKFGETTLALRKRLICINCKMRLDGREDSSIEDRLYAERDGIVSKLMGHLLNIKRNKKIFIYDENDTIVQDVERDSSVYTRYFYDRIEYKEGSEIWQDQVWKDFKKYIESEDYEFAVSKSVLGKKMANHLTDSQVRRKRNNGKVRTVYRDITFRPEGDYSDEYID